MTLVALPTVIAGAVQSVAAAASLPATEVVGAIRYAIAEETLYTFNGTTWAAVAGGGGGGVTSVNGQTGVVVLTTTNIAEGTNLYFTAERTDDRVAALIQNGTGIAWTYDDTANTLTGNVSLAAFTTSNLAEGANLYYTAARFNTAFAGKSTTDLAEGTNLYYTAARFNTAFAAKSTTDLAEGSNLYYTNARVDTQVATQKGVANGIATLDAGGKVPVAQLPNSIMEYKGTWAASTNTPTLANGTGNAGDVYIASDAGTVNFGAGNITFAADDWVIYNGTIWQKSSNSNSVASVNGFTGAVVLTTTDIAEGTNLYYTDERVDDRVAALLVAGTAISLSYSDVGNSLTVAALVASNAVVGVVNTSAQSFAGLKKLEGGLASAEYVGTDPEVGGSTPFQLLNASKRVQIINPAGAITVKLPTTSILAGERVEIVNRSVNAVTVQSSDSDQLVVLVSGSAEFLALQNTPTDATHWAMVENDSVHSVKVYQENGYGSTATTTQRFANTEYVVGSAITLTDSVSNSTEFTINERGLYSISFSAGTNDTGPNPIAIALNSDGATSAASLTGPQTLAFAAMSGTQSFDNVAWTGQLSPGDSIRGVRDGSGGPSGGDQVNGVQFTITKIKALL